jgi:pimeloyl-ACP methyl ester carboxylesterase
MSSGPPRRLPIMTDTTTDLVTTAAGDRVAYDLRGSGPALIFVAGAGPYRATDPVTTETAERAAALGLTTVVFDRLGRGESAAAGRLDLERELAAVDALIDLVGGRAALCGHSSGCAISLRAAARPGAAGDRVSALALWEAPLESSADETQVWADEIERRIDAGDLAGATEHFMKDMPPEWLAGAKASPDWEHIAASVVSQRADAQALAWAQRALDDMSLAPRVPVLAMYGAETFPGMPEAAERIAAVVPDGRVEQAPGAGHTWEPEPMARRLAAFVAG